MNYIIGSLDSFIHDPLIDEYSSFNPNTSLEIIKDKL